MKILISKTISVLTVFVLIGALVTPCFADVEISTAVAPNYAVRLGGGQVMQSSPAIADLFLDGKYEIIVGTTAARTPWGGSTYYDQPTKLSVVSPTGSIVWEVTTRAPINSTPAVGDLNGDGYPEIAIGVGGVAEDQNHDGGLFVYDRFGHELWHVDTAYKNSAQYRDGVYSSPAIGDINNDGIQEVVFGSWDNLVYAVRGTNGALLPGWPFDVWDTIWSSPALADINRDGYLEVIIGGDITANPIMHTQDGGRLHVLEYNGTELPGFPVYQDQVFWSSPAVGDIDGDGWPEIVTGTGHNFPGKGYKVLAYRHDGSIQPGWPVATTSYTFSSPVIVDLFGDGHVRSIAVSEDGKVYAINGDGSIQWVHTLKDRRGVTGPQIIQTSVATADYNGDGFLELFINYFWEVVILDRFGNQLTYDGSGADRPVYLTSYSLYDTPTVADIDGDGRHELIVAGSNRDHTESGYVYIWKLGTATGDNPWPMFRKNPRHQASVLAQSLQVGAHTAVFYLRPNSGTRGETIFITDGSGGELDWSAGSNQSWLHISQSSGTTPAQVTLSIDSNMPEGIYSGQVTIASPGLPQRTVPVSVGISNNASNISLPLIMRAYSGGW